MKVSCWILCMVFPVFFWSGVIGGECRAGAGYLKEAERAKEASVRLSLFQRAFSLCPEEPEIGRQLALALLETRRVSEARDVLESLLSRFPALPSLFLTLAEVSVAEGDFRRAVRLYEVVLELNAQEPQAREVLEALAGFQPLAFARRGEEEGSLRVFFEGRRARRVLERFPEDALARRKWATYLLFFGRRLLGEGKTQEAEEAWRRALSLDPNFEEPKRALADLYMEGGDFEFRGEKYEASLQAYQTGLRWLPDSIPLHIRIGKTYERVRGREAQALRAYQRARELLAAHPSEGSAAQRAGWAEAIEEGFAQVDAEHPVYRRREAVRELSAAERAIRQRHPREAAEAYVRAIHWTPQDPLIHYELAHVYRSLEGAWQDAVRHYGLALDLFKKHPPALDPAQVKLYIQRAERERANLERAHTRTLAYLRAKFFSALRERRFEVALFTLVFASVLFLLWRA